MENNLIVSALHLIIKLLEKILAKLEERYADTIVENKTFDIMQDLIDSNTVKQILKIEKSTLYRMKTSKSISTVRIGKRDYYSRIEIERLVNKFMK